MLAVLCERHCHHLSGWLGPRAGWLTRSDRSAGSPAPARLLCDPVATTSV